MTSLEQHIDASLHEILRRRKAKLVLVVVGLVLAIGTMIAMTALMYSPSAGSAGEDQSGAESSK